MSGESNVIYWLNNNNIEPSDELVDELFRIAKESDRILTKDEIMTVVERVSN